MNLNVCKLLISLVPTLSSVPTLTHTTRGVTVVRFHELVHETHPASDLINHLLPVLLREHLTPQPILTRVGNLYRMLLVPCPIKRKNRTKHLLIIHLLTIPTLYHCYRKERSFDVLPLPIYAVTFW